jgi:hypothetical protein
MTAPVKHTERTMLDLLHRRYSWERGNGPRYICAEHVRNAAGFNATRTADMIVQDLWPSTGMEIHGIEVKVSRSDWLCELKAPEKAQAFRRFCHRWWLAVPDAKIVQHDLPAGWGLLAIRGGKLVAVVTAPKLTPEPMPRSMQVALLRAVSKTTAYRALAEFQRAGAA